MAQFNTTYTYTCRSNTIAGVHLDCIWTVTYPNITATTVTTTIGLSVYANVTSASAASVRNVYLREALIPNTASNASSLWSNYQPQGILETGQLSSGVYPIYKNAPNVTQFSTNATGLGLVNGNTSTVTVCQAHCTTPFFAGLYAHGSTASATNAGFVLNGLCVGAYLQTGGKMFTFDVPPAPIAFVKNATASGTAQAGFNSVPQLLVDSRLIESPAPDLNANGEPAVIPPPSLPPLPPSPPALGVNSDGTNIVFILEVTSNNVLVAADVTPTCQVWVVEDPQTTFPLLVTSTQTGIYEATAPDCLIAATLRVKWSYQVNQCSLEHVEDIIVTPPPPPPPNNTIAAAEAVSLLLKHTNPNGQLADTLNPPTLDVDLDGLVSPAAVTKIATGTYLAQLTPQGEHEVSATWNVQAKNVEVPVEVGREIMWSLNNQNPIIEVVPKTSLGALAGTIVSVGDTIIGGKGLGVVREIINANEVRVEFYPPIQSVSATKLSPSANPTANLANNTLTLGIPQGVKGDCGDDGVSVTGFTQWFQVTNSTTAPTVPSTTSIPAAPWVTTPAATSQASRYLWAFIRIELSNGNFIHSPAALIGTQGQPGQDGSPGAPGSSGRGILNTTTTYQAHTSGTTPPTGVWATNPPATTDNQYLWARIVFTYTDNTTSTHYATVKNGSKGDPGDTVDWVFGDGPPQGAKPANTIYMDLTTGGVYK